MKKIKIHFPCSRDLLCGVLLLAVMLIAYKPALNGLPVWDDELHITPPELRSVNGLTKIWLHPRGTVQYFPLAHTVFWLEAELWGDSPLYYHLTNILLHFFSALILVKILRKLRIPGSWLAAGIFALHPVMVESVAWITELKNTLSGVFFLSAVLKYLTFSETGKKRFYISSLVLFILGLLSKTGLAPFPLAMMAVIWWKRGNLLWKRDIVPLLLFFLVSILSGLLTIYVERTFIGTKGPGYEFLPAERCLIAGRALWFYICKIFLPINLMISYPRWVVSTTVWWQYLFPAAAIIFGCILWIKRNVWRASAAVFFYFTAMILPYLGFFSLFAFRYSFVADHYQYLASIGPIVMTAVLIDKAAGSVKGGRFLIKSSVTVILLLTLGMLSWKQSSMYSDAETLYRTTIAKNTNCWMAYNNLGLLLANSGRTSEAIACYLKAIELNRNYAEPHNNLGLLLTSMGKTDEAIVHYAKALEINPGYGGAHFNLGLTLAGIGRNDEAFAQYSIALGINPDHAKAHNNLGLLLAKIGRNYEAIVHYRKALEINPNSAETHYNAAILFVNINRADEAMSHLLKALEINPNFAEAHNLAGILLANKGRINESMSHFMKALEINPNFTEAQQNINFLKSKMMHIEEPRSSQAPAQ
jgi:protein O-mannosyl-transferase